MSLAGLSTCMVGVAVTSAASPLLSFSLSATAAAAAAA